MKYVKALAALLCILTLTGCSTQTDTSAPTEPVTETAAETEALTGPETEAPTETVIPAPPPLSEKAAAWLYDTLVPQYGLSGLTSYDAAQPTPKSAQGVVSALERDFTGDGTPDLLIVRQDAQACILDLYTPTGESYALADSCTCLAAENTPAPVVSLSVHDSLLLVSTTTDNGHKNDDPAPYYQRYTVLSAADGSFAETAVLQYVSEKLSGENQRTYDFYINGKLQSPASDYYAQFTQYAQASLDALREGGIRIPDTEVMTDMIASGQIIRIVSGMFQEQQDIMRHDYFTDSIVTAIDFTALQREQNASTPEEIAYRFLRTDLIPAYGLSDSYATYDLAHHQEKGISPEFPHNAQGIISALVTDLTGDDKPELLTVRAERTSLIIDWYRIGNDTCTLAASRELNTLLPYLYLQDGRLLLLSDYGTDETHNGMDITALSLTENGLKETLHLVQSCTPDKESLTIDGEEYAAAPDVFDADKAAMLVQEALDRAGICYDSEPPYFGHYCYMPIKLSDSWLILSPGGAGAYRDVNFWDRTRLHERLLGLSRLDTPLYDPSQISTSKPDTAS
ncbi:MAG: hypothetical protein J5851_03870 [Oscillospiraceae bacterium]|nr:hypothetical protein [Oscillospiraceae bacterium]